MSIFVVIQQPHANGPKLAGALQAAYPAHYQLGFGSWLVAGKGPAQVVSDRLGITDGTNGSAVVVEVSSYFGHANPNIWSWINANWGNAAVG